MTAEDKLHTNGLGTIAMSKETNEREILSAYFDGELTPEERQSAEQLLEESSSARREIDEIAELSELVKSLPNESAPSELLPAVLSQAERETLFAAETPAPIAQRNSRSWLSVISGIAVTAAAVVLVVKMLPSPNSDQPNTIVGDQAPEMRVAANDSRQEESLLTAEEQSSAAGFDGRASKGEQEMIAGGAGAPVADEDVPGESLASAATASRGFKRALADRTPAASKVPAAAPARAAETTPQRPGSGSPAPLVADAFSMNAESLRNARQGDVVEYFSKSGTKVTTYMVTVIDVQQAVDKMQVLLARNEIPARQLDDGEKNSAGDQDRDALKRDATEKARKANKNQQATQDAPTADEADEQQDRLIAVYVETTPDRFASAFQELLREKMLADLYPKPPVDEQQIEVAQLGQSRRRLFSQSTIDIRSRQSLAAQEEAADAKPAAPPKPNAPPEVQAAQLQKKLKQIVKAKDGIDGAKTAAKKAENGKEGKASDSKQRDKAGNGLLSGRNRADAKHDATPSFQLRVELAPIPQVAEQQKSLERRANRATQPGFAAPSGESKNAPVDQEAERAESVATGKAPVRVLFVFREAPQKSGPSQ